MRIAKSHNVSLTLVLATSIVLAGCGADPAADASRTAAQPQAPAEPVIRGTKPVPATSITPAEQSSATVKCNIETIAEQSLEGVRPAVDIKRTVGIAGWYASLAPGAAPAAPAEPTEPAAPATAAEPAPAAESAGSGLQLVISDESSTRHWVVPVPERTERPDVADGLKNPDALRSGFAFDLDLSEFKAGSYNMHLSDTAHAAASICGVGRGFLVE